MKPTAHTALLLSLLFFACSKGKAPEGIISDEQFEATYIALLDSARVIQATPTDSAVHPVARRILERQGVTVDQYRTTVLYYNAHPERWKDFFDRVFKKIEQRRMGQQPG